MDYKYDVAISFLAQDEGLARELRNLLTPNLRVFEFTSRQEEISGTDGLVTFKTTFRDLARLVVVLYRVGWGETPWTRVESEAITDRFLKEGPDFLLFVMIDAAATPPRWVPEKKIRFDLATFGIEQAAGAIKLRVQELGGSVKRETLADHARRAAERRAYATETEFLKGDARGVAEVQAEGTRLVAAIEALAREASAAAPDLALEWAARDGAVAIRSPRASVYVKLVVCYVNTLNESFLSVRQMRGNIILPGDARRHLREPPVVSEDRYEPDRSPGIGWAWRLGDKIVTSDALADKAVRQLLERIDGSIKYQD